MTAHPTGLPVTTIEVETLGLRWSGPLDEWTGRHLVTNSTIAQIEAGCRGSSLKVCVQGLDSRVTILHRTRPDVDEGLKGWWNESPQDAARNAYIGCKVADRPIRWVTWRMMVCGGPPVEVLPELTHDPIWQGPDCAGPDPIWQGPDCAGPDADREIA